MFGAFQDPGRATDDARSHRNGRTRCRVPSIAEGAVGTSLLGATSDDVRNRADVVAFRVVGPEDGGPALPSCMERSSASLPRPPFERATRVGGTSP